MSQCGILQQYLRALDVCRNSEAVLYRLSQERFPIVRRITEPLVAYQRMLHQIVPQAWLNVTRWLDMVPTSVDSGISGRGRSFKILVRTQEDMRDALTRGIWHCPSSHQVPLDGEVLRHGPVARASAYIQDLANSRDVGELARIDEHIVTHLHTISDAKSNMLAQIIAQVGTEFDLQARHPKLYALMRQHDWTHRYADRTVEWAYACERAIEHQVAALPDAEAVAVWHFWSYGPYETIVPGRR